MGVGGSATTDGGMGMAESLGVIFYDRSGNKLTSNGQNLARIHSLDSSGIHPRLAQVNFTIFCDVDNPLHGPNGAAFVFSPQKGADEQMVKELDAGLKHYQKILEKNNNQGNPRNPSNHGRFSWRRSRWGFASLAESICLDQNTAGHGLHCGVHKSRRKGKKR